jgi:Lrp/AsnC family transcriptional regulator, leucine-responsive regulatory protein
MDDMDRRIVTALVANGRLTHEQIARDVHLSRPAVFERIRRLEARGVIRGYGARVDWGTLGLPLTAFVWIRTQNISCVDSGRRISELRSEGAVLESLYRVTGDWCMFAKYRVAGPAELQQMIDLVRQSPGVVSTMTTIALSSLMEVQGSEVPVGLPETAVG